MRVLLIDIHRIATDVGIVPIAFAALGAIAVAELGHGPTVAGLDRFKVIIVIWILGAHVVLVGASRGGGAFRAWAGPTGRPQDRRARHAGTIAGP